MIKLKEKFIAFFIGSFAVILLIELILRIIGIGYSEDPYSGKSLPGDRTCTILCLGDSFTFGFAVPKDKSYPSQLEDLLDLNAQDKKIIVVNGGVSGQNTTQLINELNHHLDLVHPDFIVLLSGGSNYWNFFGYQTYLKGRNFFSRFYDQLYRIRIFKLVKLLNLNIKERNKNKFLLKDRINRYKTVPSYANLESDKIISPNREEINKGLNNYITNKMTFEEEMCRIREKIEANPSNSDNYFQIGEIYKEQGKYDEALKWYNEGIRINPANSRNYCGIGIVCRQQGKYDEALKWYKKAIEIDSKDAISYSMASEVYRKTEKYKEAIEFFKEQEKAYPALKDFHKIFEKKMDNVDREITNWIATDIEKIIEICKEKKIAIILQNYPNRQRASDILENIAKEYLVPFVDHYRIFQKISLSKGYNHDDYFVPDGHCNSKGYGIMAKNLYDKIIEEELISFNKNNQKSTASINTEEMAFKFND